MNKVSLVPISLSVLLLTACSSIRRTDSWHYQLDQSPYLNGTPAVRGIVFSDPLSTASQVNIDPRSSRRFELIPKEFQELYDREPLPVNLHTIVGKTLENDRTIQIDHYDVRIAQEVVVINKGIYDTLAKATLQASRDEIQSSNLIGPSGTRRLELGNSGVTQLLPTGASLDLEYQYSRMRQNDPFSNLAALFPTTVVLPESLNPSISHAITASLTQPLWQGAGPKITNINISLSRLDKEAAGAQFEARLQDEIKNSLDLYWELLFQVERYDIRLLSYMAALDLERVSAARQKVGVGSHTDVLQARARAEARRDFVIQARQSVRDAEDMLKSAIFLNLDEPDWSLQLLPTEPLIWRDLSFDEAALVAEGTSRRPEVIAMERVLDRRDLEIFKAKDRTKPRLDLFAKAGVSGLDNNQSDALDTLESGDYSNWAVGLQFSRPIRNTSALHALEAAKLSREKSLLEYKRLRDQVALQVRLASRQTRTARQRIDVTLARVHSEEANLRDEKRRLEVGISTSFEVLAFQEFLANSQEAYIRAVVDYNKSMTALSRATGSLLESYGVKIATGPSSGVGPPKTGTAESN